MLPATDGAGRSEGPERDQHLRPFLVARRVRVVVVLGFPVPEQAGREAALDLVDPALRVLEIRVAERLVTHERRLDAGDVDRVARAGRRVRALDGRPLGGLPDVAQLADRRTDRKAVERVGVGAALEIRVPDQDYPRVGPHLSLLPEADEGLPELRREGRALGQRLRLCQLLLAGKEIAGAEAVPDAEAPADDAAEAGVVAPGREEDEVGVLADDVGLRLQRPVALELDERLAEARVEGRARDVEHHRLLVGVVRLARLSAQLEQLHETGRVDRPVPGQPVAPLEQTVVEPRAEDVVGHAAAAGPVDERDRVALRAEGGEVLLGPVVGRAEALVGAVVVVGAVPGGIRVAQKHDLERCRRCRLPDCRRSHEVTAARSDVQRSNRRRRMFPSSW